MPWLLLTNALGAAAVWALTEADIRYNRTRILDNGARDSLRSVFHRQRYTVRALIGSVLALLVCLPAWGQWDAFGCMLIGFGLGSAAYFGYRFNTGLNNARGLAPWYVSFSPWASRFDQWFAARTRQKWGKHTQAWDEATRMRFFQMKAGCSLRNAVRIGLVVGGIIYLSGLSTAIALSL